MQVIPERGKHKTYALNAIFGSYDVIERIADTHWGGVAKDDLTHQDPV